MFNLFKKSQPKNSEVMVMDNPKYTSDIEQIHHAFESAGDKLLAEAQATLKSLFDKDCEKGQRLIKLGFTKSREAVIADKIIKDQTSAKQTYELVTKYKVAYPTKQFITEAQVESICKKWGLVMGDISLYKGFVPEKNLSEIERFKINSNDVSYIVKSESTYGGNKGQIFNDGGESARRWSNIYKEIKEPMPYKICAPEKDMDIPSNYAKTGYSINEKITIPDPVVLQPVQGGYLVITAWGDEASDPSINVINQ